MLFLIRRLVALFLLLGLLVSTVAAETWPGFRGNDGSGLSKEKNLPGKWSAKQNVLWKTKLTGRGNSSPAVTKSRIYLTSQRQDKSLWVIAIDRADGKIAWQKKVGRGSLAARGPANLYAHRHNPATPTASADENNVWAFFGSGLLVCLDRAGNLVWSRDMVKDYGAYDITFGMGSSPRLWGDLLYVACMTKGPSYVVALNKKTGKQIWKTTRRLPALDDGPDSYSTPAIRQTKTGNELVVSGSDHIDGYDLKTGKRLWATDGLKIDSIYGRIIASPAISGSFIVAASGNPGGGGKGHTLAIRLDGYGSATKTNRLWDQPRSSPDSSTPVCVGRNVYLMSNDGIGTCIELASGKLVWRKRLGKGPFHAAGVAGDRKVYFINIEGTCVVLQAGNSSKVLANNQLLGTFYATPAISDGVIYLRAYETLYAIGK